MLRWLTMDELAALKDLSARIGADAAPVQAAGGNTSVKQNGLLWIKASGTWLMNALSQDIMVPEDLAPLIAAFDSDDPAAESAKSFVPADQNPSNLRPSIETTLHSVLRHRIVLHVHCVETIAVATRRDAEVVLSGLLPRHQWAFVPYVRPGPPLSRAMAARITPETDVERHRYPVRRRCHRRPLRQSWRAGDVDRQTPPGDLRGRPLPPSAIRTAAEYCVLAIALSMTLSVAPTPDAGSPCCAQAS